MYVAVIPNRRSPPAMLLRESFRENGKTKRPHGHALAALGTARRIDLESLLPREPRSGGATSRRR